MTYCVRTVTALNLRVGDVVIPDHGPHRRVTLHRLEGAHPVVVVQYDGVTGGQHLLSAVDAATGRSRLNTRDWLARE